MTRYLERFYNHDPMVELSEAEARSRGHYVIEDEGVMRRYRRFFDGKLDSLIYSGWDDVSEPIADVMRRGDNVAVEIHSPVEGCSHGGWKWRIYYLDPSGTTKVILEREYTHDGDPLRVSRLGPHGDLLEYTIYHYHDGALYELTTHGADGAMTSRRDV